MVKKLKRMHYIERLIYFLKISFNVPIELIYKNTRVIICLAVFNCLMTWVPCMLSLDAKLK